MEAFAGAFAVGSSGVMQSRMRRRKPQYGAWECAKEFASEVLCCLLLWVCVSLACVW